MDHKLTKPFDQRTDVLAKHTERIFGIIGDIRKSLDRMEQHQAVYANAREESAKPLPESILKMYREENEKLFGSRVAEAGRVAPSPADATAHEAERLTGFRHVEKGF